MLVFSGNETLRSRFNNTRAAGFAQFTSRIGPRIDLKQSTAADVAALALHGGAREPQAIAYLEKRTRGGAGLRQVANFLNLGRAMAGDGAIRVTHLKQAASVLGAVQ